MPLHRTILLLSSASALLWPLAATAQASGPAEAQQNRDSAAAAAIDAFGERVGLNAVGLYSEYQMRGFDLMASSGAFRLDGFYYHPAAFPSESLIAGSTVHVGISATALDLPSPTGVIAYRLRDPGNSDSLSITTGLRDEETPHVEVLGTLVSADARLGILGHAFYAPDANRGWGEEGSSLHTAGVGRWRLGPDTDVRLFGSYSLSRYDGDISVLASGEGVPPPLPANRLHRPDWMRFDSRGGNGGALFEHRRGRWSVAAAAIRSINRVERSDVAVLEIDRAGNVASTIYHTPTVKVRSDTAEAKIARTFSLLGAEHRLGLAVRQRLTVTGRAMAAAFPGGSFTIDDPSPALPVPALPEEVARGRDQVDQRIVSATYGLVAGKGFELRLGAHSNRYEKNVRDFDGQRFHQRDRTWLYSASAIWSPAPRWKLFASFVSGLEESGVAPAAAANRGEVLPPVEARQYELGARFEITPQLSLIAAGFDIRKPIYGLRPDTLYAPVGTVRHRGIEASLTGRVGPGTTVVLGANVVQPTVGGEQVEAGLVRRTAPGVSRFNATVSIEQQITPAWSIDGYVLHEGGRRRDSTTATEVAGVPFAILGTRYQWSAGTALLALRAQLINALDRKGYYATPYGPLVPISPLTYRLLLTASF